MTCADCTISPYCSCTSALVILSYAVCWHMSLLVESTVSLISWIILGDSSMSWYMDQWSGRVVPSPFGYGKMLEGVVDVSYLLSIRASNVSIFLTSISQCSSYTYSLLKVRLDITSQCSLRIRCAISFPTPEEGPRTWPSTSRLNRNRSVLSL